MHREQLSSLDLKNFPPTIIQTGIPPSPTTTRHHVLKRIFKERFSSQVKSEFNQVNLNPNYPSGCVGNV